tara:strand:+ start:1766 stop:2029 length:264 start_codon:yes stop_codon:yes gene_type:complete
MTKIYIYCLFERGDKLCGVYSSIKAAHRDALKICNTGGSPVYLRLGKNPVKPTVRILRNIFKGEMDLKVTYHSDKSSVTILKTKLKE